MSNAYLALLTACIVTQSACLALDTEPGNRPLDATMDSATSDGGREAGPLDAGQPTDSSMLGDGTTGTDSQTLACDATHPCQDGVCDPSGKCVQCVNENDCGSTSPMCNGENKCVQCMDDSDCSVDTPVCDPEGRCTGCDGKDNACQRFEDSPLCGANGACVQCRNRSDCASETPHCTQGGTCTGCVEDADCAGVGKVCDEANQQCVACMADRTEAAQCGGFACNPITNTCTGRPIGGTGGCEQCLFDSECSDGMRCVPTDFQGNNHGNYCLLVAPTSPLLCPNQYAARRAATSTSGASGDYCFPNDTFATCESLLDFKEPCMSDPQCGAPALADGLCRDSRCTYGCDSNADCSGADKCIGPIGAKYCNPN